MSSDLQVGDPKSYAVIGAAMEVHNIMGPGFQESVYGDCLAIELTIREIPFVAQVPFPVAYKGHRVGGFYRADFVCFDQLILELKATSTKSTPLEHAQMLNYLTAAQKRYGLMLNFGGPRLLYQRFIMSPKDEAQPAD
jgi:GxxExxY protein